GAEQGKSRGGQKFAQSRPPSSGRGGTPMRANQQEATGDPTEGGQPHRLPTALAIFEAPWPPSRISRGKWRRSLALLSREWVRGPFVPALESQATTHPPPPARRRSPAAPTPTGLPPSSNHEKHEPHERISSPPISCLSWSQKRAPAPCRLFGRLEIKAM